jgi:hypothetical protein
MCQNHVYTGRGTDDQTRLDTCRNDDASGAVIVLGLVWPWHGKGWPLSQGKRHILAKFPHY